MILTFLRSKTGILGGVELRGQGGGASVCSHNLFRVQIPDLYVQSMRNLPHIVEI
jgi:hypothetical protein